jgi:DNA polymerase/3'-5' exonuclease PolX
MSNDALMVILGELRDVYDVLGDAYRARALHLVIEKIARFDFRITAETITRLRADIGQGIYAKVNEFLRTGKIAELDNLRNSPRLLAHRELGGILGAGPQTIERWIEAGIYSLADLRKALGAGTVKLTNMQKWGVKYYEDLNTRIPRAEVEALGRYMKSLMMKITPNIIFEIAGSYRRGHQTSGDIDIIVTMPISRPSQPSRTTHPPRSSRSSRSSQSTQPTRPPPPRRPHGVIDLLSAFSTLMADDPNFIDIIGLGKERLTFLYMSPLSSRARQIDILNIAPDAYYAALMYFTGSYSFNTMIRGEAKNKGYRLNQNGLFKVLKGGKLRLIPTKSEAEIFAALGREYVPPAKRE